jgi:hypothetical protein
MANASYANGSVSVTTTATKVCTVPAENDDVLVSCSAATVFGGPNVTATTGVSVPASTSTVGPFRIPSIGGTAHDLYAIVGTSTSTVTFLYPEV